MANNNRRNPNANAAAEPTHQSRQAAGKRPTADSPALRFSLYDKGQPKDPPDSSAGTKIKRRGNHKSPPELLLVDPNPQQNVELPVILDHQEVTAQPPLVDPAPPQIEEPSAKSTMPTLVPLPAYSITPVDVNRQYLEHTNRSPYFRPPKKINAASLLYGADMTPLDHNLPAAAMLEQVLMLSKIFMGKMAWTFFATWTLILEMVITLIAVRSMLLMMVASHLRRRLGGRGLVGI